MEIIKCHAWEAGVLSLCSAVEWAHLVCEPVNNNEHLWAVHVLIPVMEIRLSYFIDVGRRLSLSPRCGAVGGTVHLEIQQNPYLLIQLVSHGALRRLSTLWCKLSPLAYVCTLFSILVFNRSDYPNFMALSNLTLLCLQNWRIRNLVTLSKGRQFSL